MSDAAHIEQPSTDVRQFIQDVLALGWNAEWLAIELGLPTDRATRRWFSGSTVPPEPVAAWVARLAAFRRANPPPPMPERHR
jgi:hypothetical protein